MHINHILFFKYFWKHSENCSKRDDRVTEGTVGDEDGDIDGSESGGDGVGKTKFKIKEGIKGLGIGLGDGALNDVEEGVGEGDIE